MYKGESKSIAQHACTAYVLLDAEKKDGADEGHQYYVKFGDCWPAYRAADDTWKSYKTLRKTCNRQQTDAANTNATNRSFGSAVH